MSSKDTQGAMVVYGTTKQACIDEVNLRGLEIVKLTDFGLYWQARCRRPEVTF